jgi:predicted esterase
VPMRAGGYSLPMPSGQVLVAVDKFAFTANNITYAVLGRQLNYWDFFAAPDGWGNIPVWGFGDVIASRHNSVPTGARLFGYFPMSTHLVMQPANVSPGGLIDGAPRREKLPAIYNRYAIERNDDDPAREDFKALLWPLFATSFLLDDLLADNAFFGARVVVLSSASSKVAMGLAHLLRARCEGAIEVIGLTSSRNRAFTERLGCYDAAVPYDALTSLAADQPTAFIDFAGDAVIRRALHVHLGDALKYSGMVGLTHQGEQAPADDLPGAKPVWFFAPDQIRKRRRDWGPGGFEARLAAAWGPFVEAAGGGSLSCVAMVRRKSRRSISRHLMAGSGPIRAGSCRFGISDSQVGTTLDGPRIAPRSGGSALQLVVLVHGYGADGNDLIDLGRAWQGLLPDAAFVSPHAPEPLEGAQIGRQWFRLTYRDPHERWRGVTAVAPILVAFLDAELERHGLPSSALALVGFSQGAMLALHVGLRRAAAPAAIVGYSGMFVLPTDGKLESLAAEVRSRPPVLLIHGDIDDVIPVEALFDAAETLASLGIPAEWHLSAGIGHGIDPGGFRHGGEFLARRFQGRYDEQALNP